MGKSSKMVFTLLSACIALADNNIKNQIEKLPDDYSGKDLFKGRVSIVKHHNKGFACNYLDDKREFVKNVSVLVLGIALINAIKDMFSKDTSDMKKTANALIIGGAFSNTFDRIRKKYVVDYFKIKKTGIIYNISDFSIFAGAILTVLDIVNPFQKLTNITESQNK